MMGCLSHKLNSTSSGLNLGSRMYFLKLLANFKASAYRW